MASSTKAGRSARCPICGKEAVEAYRPFCSKRCADIDLARWFTGGYAIAGRDDDEDDSGTLPGRQTPPEDDDDSA